MGITFVGRRQGRGGLQHSVALRSPPLLPLPCPAAHPPLHTQKTQVGLGTDVAGGPSPSMLSAVRHAVVASRALAEGTSDYRHNHHLDGGGGGREEEAGVDVDVAAISPPPDDGDGGGKGCGSEVRLDWKEALFLATMGGAMALGIEAEVGSFGVGMAFDALVVDVCGSGDGGGGVVWMDGWDTKEDLVEKWVNCGDDRHVKHVFVEGREIKGKRGGRTAMMAE